MRIVHLLDHDINCFGGIENYVRDLAEIQAKEGNEVFVVSSADTCLISNNSTSLDRYSFTYVISKDFSKILKYVKIADIIFFHFTSTPRPISKISYYLLTKTKKKGIFVLHVDPLYAKVKGQIKEIRRLVYIINKTNSTGLTFSNNAAILFRQYGIKYIYAIPIGINIDKMKGIIDEGKKKSFEEREFLATANSGRSYLSLYIKGIDRFVNLIRQLSLHSKAIIFGNSPYISIKSIALSREEFLRNLLKVKIFFQLSRVELFSIAVLEAILTSTPVVVTNVGGLPENAKYGIVINNINEAKRIIRDIAVFEDTYTISKLKRIINKNREYALKTFTIQNSWRCIQKIVEQNFNLSL